MHVLLDPLAPFTNQMQRNFAKRRCQFVLVFCSAVCSKNSPLRLISQREGCFVIMLFSLYCLYIVIIVANICCYAIYVVNVLCFIRLCNSTNAQNVVKTSRAKYCAFCTRHALTTVAMSPTTLLHIINTNGAIAPPRVWPTPPSVVGKTMHNNVLRRNHPPKKLTQPSWLHAYVGRLFKHQSEEI